MQFAGGLIEHECPRCHRAVELPLGALCRSCTDTINRLAGRWGTRVALVTTILLAAYIYFFRHPVDGDTRRISIIAVIVWFTISNVVVRRAIREMNR